MSRCRSRWRRATEALSVPDPHSWFTPQNAAVYVRNILRAVSQLDAEHAAHYEARAELYLAQLRTLDAWIVKQCNAIPRDRRILVTSHDAFGYFCQQYGFRSAAPTGWSTGQEIGGGITYGRRKAAVESIQKFGVKAIFVETSVNPKLIKEISAEAGVVDRRRVILGLHGAGGLGGRNLFGHDARERTDDCSSAKMTRHRREITNDASPFGTCS